MQTAQQITTADYRIYVACLASYNNGALYGAWIDCDGKDADQISQEVLAMLAKSKYPNVMHYRCTDCGHIHTTAPDLGCDECGSAVNVFASAEEFAIHDHEGLGGLIGEHTGISELADIVDALESAENPAALMAWADNLGSLTDAIESFEDAYRGEWGSQEAYAQQLADDIGELNNGSLAARYFDYAAFTRDLFLLDCTSIESGSGVYVFDNN